MVYHDIYSYLVYCTSLINTPKLCIITPLITIPVDTQYTWVLTAWHLFKLDDGIKTRAM